MAINSTLYFIIPSISFNAFSIFATHILHCAVGIIIDSILISFTLLRLIIDEQPNNKSIVGGAGGLRGCLAGIYLAIAITQNKAQHNK